MQGQLETNNQELKLRAEEANARSAEAIEQRQIIEELLFAADIQHASQIWKKGDVRETGRILSRYAAAPNGRAGIYGPDNFAWRFLWNHATTPFSDVYSSHQAVWWMQPSPDGRELAMCGSQGQLQFLKIDDKLSPGRSLNAGSTEIGCLSYSDDLQLIATASDDGLVRVYDQETLALRHSINAIPEKRVFGVLFLPGSHEVLACGESNSLALCQTDTGQLLKEIETPFERVIEFMTLSPDRSRLLMAGSDGQVVQMKLNDFSVVCQREVSKRTVTMARYSPDGTRIVCVGTDNTVHLLDAESEVELLSYKNLDSIHTVLVTPDDYVVIGDRGGVLAALRLPDAGMSHIAEDWRPALRWAGHDSPVSAAVWLGSANPSDRTPRQIISADRTGLIRSWEIVKGIDREVIPTEAKTTRFSPDAVCVARDRPAILRGGQKGISGFNLSSLEKTGSHLPGQCITAVCSPRLSERIIAGNCIGQLLQTSSSGLESANTITVFPEGVIERLMTDEKAEFAVASDKRNQLAVIDILQGHVLTTLENRAASAISPDGRWIASARHGRDDVEVFARADQMRSETILPAHLSTVAKVLFSPDSKYLITTSHDRMITVWTCTDWQLLHRLSGHQSAVLAAAISADGKTLATGDEAGLIKLWDLAGGREMLEMDQPVTNVTGLQFSPDGQKLIAWDEDLTISILQSPDYSQRSHRNL
jgi:WD40 repeat protein